MGEERTVRDDRVDFAPDELFFSRTDDRGIIKAGNSVFERISGYSTEELHNAPHKIVRHPDMPRAVFWLMWDRLKRGEPVGAYVKNRTKNGGYYWVYAMATPVSDGYLSVRLRPETSLLNSVAAVYETVREQEQDKSVSPEHSAAVLLEHLAGHGFQDYGHFMARSAVKELAARDKTLQRPTSPELEGLKELIDASAKVITKSADVRTDFHRIRSFPINLRIQSNKLKGAGRLFGVISTDYARFVREIDSQLNVFMDGSKQIAAQMSDAVFRMCTARVQEEMAKQFVKESGGDDDPTITAEIERLRAQAAEFGQSTSEALKETESGAIAFGKTSADVNWLIGGLDVVRTLGMVETSRLGQDAGTLSKMMDDAEKFQGQIQNHLTELSHLNSAVLQQTQYMARAV